VIAGHSSSTRRSDLHTHLAYLLNGGHSSSIVHMPTLQDHVFA